MDDERVIALLYKLGDQMGQVWRSEIGMSTILEYIKNRLNKTKLLEEKLESMDGDLQKLQDECDKERYDKERLREENKELRDLCQKLQVAPVQQEYDYRVVRTYDETVGQKTKELDDYLKAGYEFVHASEYVRADYGPSYIEYVVRKRRQQT